MYTPKCHCCGKFFSMQQRYAWKMVYSGYPQTPDEEIFMCYKCLGSGSGFTPQEGIKKEFSCGIVENKQKGE